jgi:hypothetical protein
MVDGRTGTVLVAAPGCVADIWDAAVYWQMMSYNSRMQLSLTLLLSILKQ